MVGASSSSNTRRLEVGLSEIKTARSRLLLGRLDYDRGGIYDMSLLRVRRVFSMT